MTLARSEPEREPEPTTPRRSILVVDDHRDFARGVALTLGVLDADVRVVHSAREAIAALAARPADLVLTDVRMPGMDGAALLVEIKRLAPRTRVVLFTGFGTIEAAVAAMKAGASHYLTKPVDDEELLALARDELAGVGDADDLARLRDAARGACGFHGIVTRDPAMERMLESVRRVAPSSATVLIQGESGTGKERVAAALHAESPRARAPFVAFNAAAVPDALAESVLFGHRRGAFTGADRDARGLFAEANGGTLLIDEVQSMPASLQGKLLRALEEREVLPIGATTPIAVDVRIVAAANADLPRLVREGRMRRDLYYRLSVVRILLPPLRERPADIPLLAMRFLDQRAGPPRRLSLDALRLLAAHDWPGNVRELQNVIERAALMSTEEEIGPAAIDLEDVMPERHLPGEVLDYEDAKRMAVEQFQRRYVQQILAESGGNFSAAARRAGITRAALHRIVKRLGIAAHDDDPR
jgi:DNA-binding NtrC family response regulator